MAEAVSLSLVSLQGSFAQIQGSFAKNTGNFFVKIGLVLRRYRALLQRYMAPLPRENALLRTTPGSVSTLSRMAVILFLLLHSRSLQHTVTHCNTLQYTATLCNKLHCSACHHKVTWGSFRGPFLIVSLVRTWNTFPGASLFILVTWLIRSEEKHPRTHVCDMKTHTFPFMCVTWIEWHEKRSFIHICDMALPHSHVWPDSFTAKRSTHASYAWHQDKPSLLHMCDLNSVTWEPVTYPYVWQGTHSFMSEWKQKRAKMFWVSWKNGGVLIHEWVKKKL